MPEHNFSRGIEMQNFYLRMKNKLDEAGILGASFELRELFGFVTGRKNYEIRLENEFSDEEIVRIEELVDRRIAGEPLQYLLGEWEFMGLPVAVGEGVLIPRPETELLCEQGFDFLETRPTRRVLDLCCGTGCIGIAAKKYVAGTEVVCVDKFDAPLRYTAENAAKNGVSVAVVRGDALLPPSGDLGVFDLILTNPPYILTNDLSTLQTEVKHEPREALDGGADGLMFYRALTAHWLSLLRDGGAVMAEIGIGEKDEVEALFVNAGLKNVRTVDDYCGIPRVVRGEK